MSRALTIAGSLRAGSLNRRLLGDLSERAPEGLDLEIWDGLGSLPPYDEDEDVDPAPHAVEDLRRAIRDADGLVLSTPEYNASIPGVLKNAVDWASRPADAPALEGVPVLVVGASTGMFGAVWAQAELRKSLSTARAAPLDFELAVPAAHRAFDETGRLLDPGIAERAEQALDELVAAIASSRRPARV